MSELNTNATYSNQIRIGESSETKKSSEYFLFGADQVFVGKENPNEREIITNEITQFREARNKVDRVEVYNLHKQSHHCWLLLDFETGGRGWYPGCKEVVDIYTTDVYTSADDSSAIIQVAQEGTYDKLDLEYGPTTESTGKIIYCKIKLSESSSGYIKESKVIRTRYADRTN